jgi:tRNA(Leu) C34 or U34 (ribose-2'-O)-methylase TrmL
MKDRDEPLAIDLIADGIADPRNVPALLALADLLHCRCLFRDRHDLRSQFAGTPHAARMTEAPPLEAFREHYDLLLAVENHVNASSIYEYRPPQGKRLAVVVGNERKGLDRKVSRMADVMLEVPMRPRPGISLNVAGAAAAALYQLLHAGSPKRHKRTRVGARPELVFWEPRDAADLGSSLRAAYALGWDSARVMDRHHAWFDADRATRAQGRGAARRHKTAIRVRPFDPGAPAEPFDVAFLLAAGVAGTPVWRMHLPPRESCALVYADAPLDPQALAPVARECVPLSLGDEPAAPADAPLRILSAISLTEVARLLR